ncbi:hypothetical protein [Faecalispora sporosphaeroides]|uniref:hypothetical protein n=1 Tax=Faecalispora sporosphaeroides TaxID=1549 RepID=UPI0012B62D2B|nr:hypothetical protein [Faecalispora sporosphaeroides]
MYSLKVSPFNNPEKKTAAPSVLTGGRAVSLPVFSEKVEALVDNIILVLHIFAIVGCSAGTGGLEHEKRPTLDFHQEVVWNWRRMPREIQTRIFHKRDVGVVTIS